VSDIGAEKNILPPQKQKKTDSAPSLFGPPKREDADAKLSETARHQLDFLVGVGLDGRFRQLWRDIPGKILKMPGFQHRVTLFQTDKQING
jgi:hypothetical protein